MDNNHTGTSRRIPWNKGKLVGQKAPLRLKDIWAIRIRLQLAKRMREPALFDLAIDSKLRSCDLVKLRLRDVAHGGRIAARAIVMQQKTQRPVQFEITEPTREALAAWIRIGGLASDSFLFPSRLHASEHLSTRQYARIVHAWVGDRPGSCRLRHAHAAAHQGVADLPADEESAGRTATARTFEAGEHGAVSGHRGRRRVRDGRTDGVVTEIG